ncbi:hypothetical protein F5Y12DRAFT_757369 [Xylaria sp. FL1777]|nr:hypothetical protein F5Y12DRAFT_757369 [Xylaria sp. FL1777]
MRSLMLASVIDLILVVVTLAGIIDFILVVSLTFTSVVDFVLVVGLTFASVVDLILIMGLTLAGVINFVLVVSGFGNTVGRTQGHRSSTHDDSDADDGLGKMHFDR